MTFCNNECPVSEILVTGATGFVGGAITRRLVEQGSSVRVFVRRPTAELKSLGVEVVTGELRCKEDVERATAGVETVYHTAALPGFWGPWRLYYQTNTVGTRYVIDACRRQGVRALVFTSSSSVTADHRPQENVNESEPYPARWLANYPRSKSLAEQDVLAAHTGDGLATCALRPHLIWGAGDRHLVPRVLARAKTGKLRVVGDGRNLIDNVYIDNVVDAHLLAGEALRTRPKEVGGRAFFLSQGQPVPLWQWINEILDVAGLPLVRKRVPYPVVYRIGWALECLYRLLPGRGEPPMTRFLAVHLALSHYYDISRARSLLGYTPRIDHAEGMRRLAAGLRDAQ